MQTFIQLTIRHGADVNAVSDSGSTPVRSACYIVRPGENTGYNCIIIINIISNIMIIISSNTIINITTMVIIGTWRSSKLWWRLAQTYRCQIILVALASSTGGDFCGAIVVVVLVDRLCNCDDFGGIIVQW